MKQTNQTFRNVKKKGRKKNMRVPSPNTFHLIHESFFRGRRSMLKPKGPGAWNSGKG